jgi:ABC-type uncharacterized transport system permease subunit
LAIAGIIYGIILGLPVILACTATYLHLISSDVIAGVLFLISATSLIGFFYYACKDISTDNGYTLHAVFLEFTSAIPALMLVAMGKTILIVVLAIEFVSIIVYFTPLPKKFCKALNKGGN